MSRPPTVPVKGFGVRRGSLRDLPPGSDAAQVAGTHHRGEPPCCPGKRGDFQSDPPLDKMRRRRSTWRIARSFLSASFQPGFCMNIVVITGSAGLIGAEAVRFFSAQGLPSRRHRQRHAARFFGEDASTELEPPWARGDVPQLRPPRRSTSATAAAIDGALRAIWQRHQAGDPHGGPAVARLGRPRSAHRFHRQRQRDADTCWRRRAGMPRGGLHLHLAPTRSTATRRTACRWSSRRPAGRSTRPPLSRPRHRRDDVASTRPSTRCSARRSWPPTCWSRSTAATSA